MGRGLWTLACWLVFAYSASAADRIILRNLEVITDRTVASFDEDGVVLDDRRVLTWDEVEKASLGNRQAEFDQMLATLGEPLYRIRQRLSVGDYQGLLNHAEAVFPHFVKRRSKTAYMVFQALMWGRLDAGRRELAVEPYLLGIECLRAVPAEQWREMLPGERQLRWYPETGLSDELPPVWFDADAAREAVPRVGRAIAAMRQPWPDGARVYYASLALAAGDTDRARAPLEQLDTSNPIIAQMALLLSAQQEIERGEPAAATQQVRAAWSQYEGLSRALALYWLGRAGLGAEELPAQQDAMLLLMRLPAEFGEQYPELAAAGLYHTTQALAAAGDRTGSVAVRGELLDRYSGTYYALRLRSAASRTDGSPP